MDEVCLDSTAVSTNAEEAALLQGEAVREWCAAALQRWSAPCVRRGATVDELDRCVAALQGVGAAAQTLAEAAEAAHAAVAGASSQPTPQLRALRRLALEAARHAQHAEVALWAASHRADLAPFEREAPPRGEWEASVARRRAMVGEGATTFLDDIVGALSELAQDAGAPAGWPAYPPADGDASVADFAQGLLLEGAADAGSLQAKHALLLYFLLDLGLPAGSPPFESLVARLLLPAAFVLDVRAYFWLDDDREESLDAAAATLPLAASPATPAKIPAALLARGRPEAALAVLRAAGDSAATLARADRAAAGVGARLACGLVEEAFLHARQCAAAATAEHGAAGEVRRDELVAQIARACVAERAAPRLVQLPFDDAEEAALTAVLEALASARPESCAGDALVVYFLQRARGAAAEAAHRALAPLEEAWADAEGAADEAAASARRNATADRAFLVAAAMRGRADADAGGGSGACGVTDAPGEAMAEDEPTPAAAPGAAPLLAVAGGGGGGPERAHSTGTVASPFVIQQPAVTVAAFGRVSAAATPGGPLGTPRGVARAPSAFGGVSTPGGLFAATGDGSAGEVAPLPPMASLGTRHEGES